ncbi:MAG: ABC transporter ATP-binding protein [Anaerolineaceae bacterium]|nr:ABC transporter ATP-binding protein [Anaerolineaceae bacterium]
MLKINDLRVEYEKGVPTLDHYDLTVNEGELVSLLGPSGCGKTTTLRAVAGFVDTAGGQITISGRDVTKIPPNKRDIGLVFQSYALFPHLTVNQNVAFGLRMRRVTKKDQSKRVDEALRLVDLEGLGERRPAQLSGGQQQRVALARAVVIEPQLLLLDEPLSNLDAKLRVNMRTEIRRLQQRLSVTTLYVTHDQIEALAISDRVVVMNHGRIEQSGTPEEIYKQPQTPFVADFMGFENHFAGTVSAVDTDALTVQAADTTFQASQASGDLRAGDEVWVYFRSESAQLAADAVPNSVPVNVLLRTFQGNAIEYVIQSDLGEFKVRLPEDQVRFDAGPAYLSLNPDSLIVMPK